MLTKSEKTRLIILESVAPLFNRLGYAATSMSDITSATGLTKGAIYGHFSDKEDLAVAAFKFNLKRMLERVSTFMGQGQTPIEKLRYLAKFYGDYERHNQDLGGCPILRIGTDATHTQPMLLNNVQQAIKGMEAYLTNLIKEGIDLGEIDDRIAPTRLAKRFYSLIQGAVFMSNTMNDPQYLVDVEDQLSEIIDQQLKKN